MKALTLWQPWASLVQAGLKTIETRSWSTNYRGPLAIHAAKRSFGLNSDQAEVVRSLPLEDWRRMRVRVAGDCELGDNYPQGVVVATCELVDVVPTEQVFFDGQSGSKWIILVSPSYTSVHSQSGNEPLGDFSPGRYAWLLDNIQATPGNYLLPVRGRQQLWDWRP